MKHESFQHLRHYGIAVLCVAAASLAWVVSTMLIGPRISSSFFLVAVIAACRFGGPGPGWLAVTLGTIPVIYTQSFMPGRFGPAFYAIIAVHIGLSVILVLLANSERKARRRADAFADDGLKKQQLLEQEIAERQIVEQELREQRQQTEMALQAGGQGTWAWDVQTNHVHWSPTNESIHGCPPGEFRGTFEDALSYIHPDDRPTIHERIAKLFAEGQSDHLAYRVIWPDQSIRWIEGLGQMFRGDDGTPLRLFGVCSDITDRWQSEVALRKSEERFRQLATHSPVGIVEADSQGRCTFVNQRWCEMAGISSEEALGEGWRVAVHPDDRNRIAEEWSQAVLAGQGCAGEARFLKPSGEVVWVHFCCAVVPNEDGTPQAYISTVVDITKRKAFETALAAKEAQLSGVLDNTPAIVYLKDPEGRHLLTNRRYQVLFQNGSESIIGKKDTEIFPEPIARKFQESDAKVWKEQVSFDFEEDAPHQDGIHTYRSVKFPVRDEAGRMIALGGISTDISDLKQAHEALKAKEELLLDLIEVQEDEKHFLCQEFHDGLIQYAVGSLMSLEGFRSRHPTSEDSASIDMVINNLRKGVDDGRRVIRGVRPAVLDDSGLEAAIEDLVDQFSTGGMLVTSKCEAEIGRLPETIQTTIYRVVQEALNNARKHSGTDVVRIYLRKSNGDLHLDIRDFGSGFDVESAWKKGFGLRGMTERVRLLGGECHILSDSEDGTQISVQLPIQSTP